MSEAPTVLAVWARVVAEDLRQHRKDAEGLFAKSGINLRTVNHDGARIPQKSQAHLLDSAARELGDDCYGLHLSSRAEIRDADALGYLGLASRTLGEALANLERYARVFNKGARIELSTDGDTAIVELNSVDPSILHQRQQMEFSVGILVHAYRVFTGRNITPIEVDFVHDRREGRRELTRLFGCKVAYLQKHARIVLKLKDLNLPIATADNRLLKILQAHCEAVLRDHGTYDEGLLPKVEREVVDLLPQGQARAKVIAAHLGLSDRTLTRRLSGLGTSFDGILDRLRHQLALKYVTGSDLSLTEVAFLLGYANQPAFSLAFKRWTGRPPSDMRAA
jgi:AraC-like DNA-binding protein